MGSGLPARGCLPTRSPRRILLPPGRTLRSRSVRMSTRAIRSHTPAAAADHRVWGITPFVASRRQSGDSVRSMAQHGSGLRILGTHRTGLRTRSLPAPCAGAIRGVPDLGALAILPTDERRPLLANRPGVVAAIDPAHITITSLVLRCPSRYRVGAERRPLQNVFAPRRGDGVRSAATGESEEEAVITAISLYRHRGGFHGGAPERAGADHRRRRLRGGCMGDACRSIDERRPAEARRRRS